MKKKVFNFFLLIIITFVLIYNPISTRIFTIIIAKYQNIDSEIFYKQIKTESSFNPLAVSPQKAIGLGQVKLSTASYIYPPFKKWMLWLPPLNLYIAAEYNKYLLNKYNNNWFVSLAAYNWGETNVDKHLKKNNIQIDSSYDYSNLFKNIPETRNYLFKIMGSSN